MDEAGISPPISFEAAREALLKEVRPQSSRIVPAELDRLAWERVWKMERAWNMNRLRTMAGSVVYHQCDLTRARDVRRLVEDLWREYGRFDLVIQGGGDLREKSVEDFSADEFTAGLKSKALGTACLLAALSAVPVGTFINLSSIAGRWGNMGQASYAAGHEIASILVSGSRGRRPGRWINVFFGPWLNAGMTRQGAVMERLGEKDTDFITEKMGGEFLYKEYRMGPGHNVAFYGNMPQDSKPDPIGLEVKPESPAPFMDEVKVVSNGVAEGRKLLDPQRDRYVADHFIAARKPILPGVVGLEMIAQTAAALVDADQVLTDIENVNFIRAGRFPRNEPREYQTRVRLISRVSGEVRVSGQLYYLLRLPGSSRADEIRLTECEMRFGTRKEPGPPSLLTVDTGLTDYRLDADPLYDTKVYHLSTGIYKPIKTMASVTPEGMKGDVRAIALPDFGPRPCLDNPLRLDALLRITCVVPRMLSGSDSYYFRSVDSIRFYGSDDPGEGRFCRVRIREANDTGCVGDVEAVDRRGRVTQTMTGVREVAARTGEAIDLKEPIWDIMRDDPRRADITRFLEYRGGLRATHLQISLVKAALAANQAEILEEHLNRAERNRFHDLKHEKRRLEWLAGRIAAKAAVRLFLDLFTQPPSAVEVASSADGSPYVVMAEAALSSPPPHISISHSGDIAAAVAGGRPGIGLDIQEINASIEEIADEFCTSAERELTGLSAGRIDAAALTAVWTAKEAAWKAAAAKWPMKELTLDRLEQHSEYWVGELRHPAGGRFKSVTFFDGNYCFAVGSTIGREPETVDGG